MEDGSIEVKMNVLQLCGQTGRQSCFFVELKLGGELFGVPNEKQASLQRSGKMGKGTVRGALSLIQSKLDCLCPVRISMCILNTRS